jgi:hypothetical protein
VTAELPRLFRTKLISHQVADSRLAVRVRSTSLNVKLDPVEATAVLSFTIKVTGNAGEAAPDEGKAIIRSSASTALNENRSALPTRSSD